MTVKTVLAKLKSLGDEKVFKRNKKLGAGEAQFGVPMGAIRKVAAEVGTDHALATELWKTGNIDARHLAILVLDPKELSKTELDRMVREASFGQTADWLNAYVVKAHPQKEALREKWMKDKHPWAARAGWSLTSARAGSSPEGLDLPALLDRIEKEMGAADPAAQWTMNACLATIGIHHPKLRKRAVAIGEKLGVLKDYPTSKGCTSPYAPIWIAEMVKRMA
jgi:3-methyladenine DNA glycosylase AlkD